VVLLAVVGGDHVQTVADVKEGSGVDEVVLHLHRGVGGGQLLSQGYHLRLGLLVQGGEDGHIVFRNGQILGAAQLLGHDPHGGGSPGAVFDEGHGALLVGTLRQLVDEGAHIGEDVGVVGGGSQHQLLIPEGIGNRLGHVGTGQVVDNHIG